MSRRRLIGRNTVPIPRSPRRLNPKRWPQPCPRAGTSPSGSSSRDNGGQSEAPAQGTRPAGTTPTRCSNGFRVRGQRPRGSKWRTHSSRYGLDRSQRHARSDFSGHTFETIDAFDPVPFSESKDASRSPDAHRSSGIEFGNGRCRRRLKCDGMIDCNRLYVRVADNDK